MKEKTANLRWFTRVVVLAAMLVTTILFTLLSSPPAYADTHTSTSTGGLWATAGTWDLGVPAATDSVIIATTGTNRVTLGAAAICAGLTINNGATLCASNSLTVNGLTSVSGTLNISSTTGNKNFNDSVTINPGGIWINRVNEPVNFRGGITNSSGTFTAGTGAYTFITNDQALTGTFLIPTLTVTGVTLTNNDELNVSTALAGTGTLTQGTGATLHLADTSFTTTLVATADGNTVDYSRAGAQTLQATTYNNLTLSGSGAKTFPIGTTTLSGSFLRQGTAALTFNNGSFVNNGGGPIDCGNALITITGNTETTQSIAGFTTTGGISITKATTTPSTVTITGDVNARTLYFTAAATNTTVSLDPGVVVTLTGAFAILQFPQEQSLLQGTLYLLVSIPKSYSQMREL
jgi:hypothetical protein